MCIDLGSVQLPVSASSRIAVYSNTVAWFMWGDSSINYSRKAVALGDKGKLLAVFKAAKIQATYLLSKMLLINLTAFHL